MLLSEVQPANAPSPMLSTLSGILMLVSAVQFLNEEPSMLSTFEGIVMFVRLWHS